MKAILIYEDNHGFLGVAADYCSAVLYLIKHGWLTEKFEVWDDTKYRWIPITELLGDDWVMKTLKMTLDEFNDFYESQFTLSVEDIIFYPKM